MKIERFQHLAAAYGADVARWPATERRDAAHLLAASPQAATAIAEAQTLDGWLDRAQDGVTGAAVERVWARVDRQLDAVDVTFHRPLWQRMRPHMPTAAFLATMWIVGVIAGTWNGVAAANDAALGSYIVANLYPQTYLTTWNE